MEVRSAPAPGGGEEDDPFELMLQEVRTYMLADERKRDARAKVSCSRRRCVRVFASVATSLLQVGTGTRCMPAHLAPVRVGV